MIRFRLDGYTARFLVNNGEGKSGVYPGEQVNAILAELEPLLRRSGYLNKADKEKAKEFADQIERHLYARLPLEKGAVK